MTGVREISTKRIRGIYLLYGYRTWFSTEACKRKKEWQHYIGQSVNVEGRISRHATPGHGWSNLRAFIIKEGVDLKDLDLYESRFMAAAIKLGLMLANGKSTVPKPQQIESYEPLTEETSRITQVLEILGTENKSVSMPALLPAAEIEVAA